MPIYEYKCTECGSHLEKLQKSTDEPLTKCDECGGKLEKQWSLSGFQFKGEGWYVTDYANKKATGGSADSSKKSDGDSADSAKKSDGDSTDSAETASKKEPEKKAEPKKEKTPSAD